MRFKNKLCSNFHLKAYLVRLDDPYLGERSGHAFLYSPGKPIYDIDPQGEIKFVTINPRLLDMAREVVEKKEHIAEVPEEVLKMILEKYLKGGEVGYRIWNLFPEPLKEAQGIVDDSKKGTHPTKVELPDELVEILKRTKDSIKKAKDA